MLGSYYGKSVRPVSRSSRQGDYNRRPQNYTEDRYTGDRYGDNRYAGDRYSGDRYAEDRYEEDRYADDRYPEDRFGEDRYAEDRFERAEADERPDAFSSPVQRAAAAAPPDDEAILEEIDRIKAETRSLRQLLADRKVQLDKVEESLTKTQAENSAMILKVAESLAEISKKLDESQDTMQSVLSMNNEELAEEVKKANKPIVMQFEETKNSLTKAMEHSNESVQEAADKVESMKASIAEIEDKLSDKAEGKVVVALHQRFTTMFAVSVANVVGTILTLGLLCYLIMALAR